jgi:hypothetical protein|tara:strand:+ start:566 stop:814 length:249 start_codon:yes stop_codon:yes gene_type:complete
MNDNNSTEINLTKKTLKGLTYPGESDLEIKFELDGVDVNTTLTYESNAEARKDYDMLINMLNATTATKVLLQEEKVSVKNAT